jgi:Ca2+/Na+ antiporter
MSHKNLAIRTAAVLVFVISLTALLTTSYLAIKNINPIAALTAITVAIIGITWFKKTH